MKLKSLVSSCLLGASLRFSAPAHAQVEIQWWHAMGGQLGEWVNDLAKGFNESQKDYKVVPTFKGSYPETLTAGIAAFRAGNAPDILQVFEVGTATMMASKGAIVPVGKVMKDAGVKFDPAAYIPAVAGYYTAPNGQMLSLPFNSSTTDLLLQQGRLQGRRPRPREAAHHLGRGRARRRQAEGQRTEVPLHDELGQLDAARELLGLAQRRVRDQEQRLRRPRHAPRLQRPAAGPPHPGPGEHGQAGPLRLQGPQQRARRHLPLGRVRHDHRLGGPARRASRRRPSSPSASRRCPTTRTSPARRRTPSSAAPASG